MAANEGGTEPTWKVRHLAIQDGEVLAIAADDLDGEAVAFIAWADSAVWRYSLGDKPYMTVALTQLSATALAVDRYGLFVGGADGGVASVDKATGDQVIAVHRIHEEGSSVTAAVSFDDIGQRLHHVSAGTDGLVHLAFLPSGASTDLQHDVDSPARSLAVTSDGHRQVIHAAVVGEIRRWGMDATGRIDDLEPLPAPWSTPDSVTRLGVGRDGTQEVLLVTDGRNIRPYHTTTSGQPILAPNVGAITALNVSADGTTIAAGGADGRLGVVTFPSGDTKTLDLGEHRISAIGSLGDTFVVGDAGGNVYVVEPADEAAARAPVLTDKVELLDDVPGATRGDDRLRRSPLAGALAVRLERRHEEGRERSFLVHLDGAWGSGKTTVLNFVADALGPDWTIVRYNAWRQSRIGPHWWTLLTALRDEILRRRSPLGRLALWTREMGQQRIRRASGLPATVLLLLVALAVYLRIRPDGTTASEVFTTAEGVGAVGVGLATLFAGAQLVARFFGWHSHRGAKAFQDLDTNPMDRVAEHFSWLVRQEERPIAYFVDDLDRCPAGDVVELLESIQTLVRDAGDERGGGGRTSVLSPCFVVAGDGAWIRNAFETHYAEFAGPIAEPGRPLGYLFLAKIFQLTLPVPRIAPVRQAAYFRELLGLDEAPDDPDDPAPSPEAVKAAGERVAKAPHDAAQQEVLAALPLSVREAVAPVAVQRQNEPAFAEATEHRLTGFAELLPDNPRAVKRFLNTFALTRSVRTIEGQAIPTGALALWTILQTRWPRLADALADHPEWVTPGSPGVPGDVRELLDADDVQAVLAFPDGGPLTPELVRACRGG